MRYLIAAVFATAGVALGVINTWNNAVQINGGSLIWNDLTAVVAGLAVTGALLSLGLGAIAQRSRLVACLAVVAIIGTIATSVGYTLGRVGSVADTGAADALAHNARLERAEQRVADLRQQVVAEAANGGCGPQCRALKSDLSAAQTQLDALGARRVEDPAGERIAAATGGLIPAAAYRTAHPVIVAGTLELGVSLLLSVAGLFAASGQRRRAPRVIDITPEPVDPVLQALKAGPVSNRELARRLGWSEAKTSRTVAQLTEAGTVTATREGRSKMIASL